MEVKRNKRQASQYNTNLVLGLVHQGVRSLGLSWSPNVVQSNSRFVLFYMFRGLAWTFIRPFPMVHECYLGNDKEWCNHCCCPKAWMLGPQEPRKDLVSGKNAYLIGPPEIVERSTHNHMLFVRVCPART